MFGHQLYVDCVVSTLAFKHEFEVYLRDNVLTISTFVLIYWSFEAVMYFVLDLVNLSSIMNLSTKCHVLVGTAEVFSFLYFNILFYIKYSINIYLHRRFTLYLYNLSAWLR